jgi:hypothetical protein
MLPSIMARPASVLKLSAGESAEPEWRLRSPTISKRDHLRAEIVWLRAQGVKEAEVAACLAAC